MKCQNPSWMRRTDLSRQERIGQTDSIEPGGTTIFNMVPLIKAVLKSALYYMTYPPIAMSWGSP